MRFSLTTVDVFGMGSLLVAGAAWAQPVPSGAGQAYRYKPIRIATAGPGGLTITAIHGEKVLRLSYICGLLLAAVTSAAQAQTYPTKPVRVINPSGAGSTTDQIFR